MQKYINVEYNGWHSINFISVNEPLKDSSEKYLYDVLIQDGNIILLSLMGVLYLEMIAQMFEIEEKSGCHNK